MSRLAEKYCIPSETVWKMVKDGVISCAWPAREDYFTMYKKKKSESPQRSDTDIFYEIASICKVAPNTVRDGIKMLK